MSLRLPMTLKTDWPTLTTPVCWLLCLNNVESAKSIALRTLGKT